MRERIVIWWEELSKFKKYIIASITLLLIGGFLIIPVFNSLINFESKHAVKHNISNTKGALSTNKADNSGCDLANKRDSNIPKSLPDDVKWVDFHNKKIPVSESYGPKYTDFNKYQVSCYAGDISGLLMMYADRYILHQACIEDHKEDMNYVNSECDKKDQFEDIDTTSPYYSQLIEQINLHKNDIYDESKLVKTLLGYKIVNVQSQDDVIFNDFSVNDRGTFSTMYEFVFKDNTWKLKPVNAPRWFYAYLDLEEVGDMLPQDMIKIGGNNG